MVVQNIVTESDLAVSSVVCNLCIHSGSKIVHTVLPVQTYIPPDHIQQSIVSKGNVTEAK